MGDGGGSCGLSSSFEISSRLGWSKRSFIPTTIENFRRDGVCLDCGIRGGSGCGNDMKEFLEPDEGL